MRKSSRIDWAGLEARYPGKDAFIERLLDVVATSNAEIPAKLRMAAVAGDLAQLVFLAHSLKGVSGNLMAWGLHAQAKAMERVAREGQPDVMVQAEALAGELDILLAELTMGLTRNSGQ